MISLYAVHGGSTLIGEQNNEKTFIYEGRLFVCQLRSPQPPHSPATTSRAMLLVLLLAKPSSSMSPPS